MMVWGALAVVLAVAVGALVKGITGLGLPLLAVPVMAAFLGVEHAVVVMAIPGVVSNVWLLVRHRDEVGATRDLPSLLVTGVLGVVLGTWLLTRANERWLSAGMAAAIAVYLVVNLSKPGFVLAPRLTRFLSPVVGFVAGVMQGSTGISGPLLATYVHAFRLRPYAYILSISTTFLAFAVTQVATITQAGLFTPSLLVESLLALVPILVLLPLGIRLSHRLDRRAFDWVVLGLLTATGLKLLFDAVSGG